jgi:hypothetical protein
VATWVNRGVVFALLAAVLLVGCTGPGIGINQPSAAAAASPPVGLTPAIDAARAVVTAAVAPSGFTLTENQGTYTPGEPQPIQALPRDVYQLNFGGPKEGNVVIYDAGSNDAALNDGAAFAEYLRTFGRSNYPGDAKFTLNAIGDALVFFWWSPSTSTETDRAAQAFDLLAPLGQPIPVVL